MSSNKKPKRPRTEEAKKISQEKRLDVVNNEIFKPTIVNIIKAGIEPVSSSSEPVSNDFLIVATLLLLC